MRYLKLQDEVVMSFDIEEKSINIIDAERLPVGLRNIMPNDCQGISRETDATTAAEAFSYLRTYLRDRTLDHLRENYKNIMAAAHIPPDSGDGTIMQIIDTGKGVSVIDDYWITEDPAESWESVSPRKNAINECLAEIALCGNSQKPLGDNLMLELTTQGSFAKAWLQDKKKALHLFKANGGKNSEVKAEVDASYILDCTNAPHIKYWQMEQNSVEVCVCKAMTNADWAIVPACEVSRWIARRKYFKQENTPLDIIDYAARLAPENFYKMLVVDYLISNADRHLLNWGFWLENKTGKITGLHPLFDHNNAFDKADMNDKEGGKSLIFDKVSKLGAAKYALKRCNFKFTAPIDKGKFLNPNNFESLIEKAAILGIPIDTTKPFSLFGFTF